MEQITLNDKILNQQAGYLALVRFLQKNNIRVDESIGFNNQRYHMIKTSIGKLMVVYKKDFFNSFGKIFAEFKETGVGETLNNEDLKSALREQIEWIYFIYRNGYVYNIKLIDFLSNSYKRTNNSEGKETRSISIKHLKREGTAYE